MPLTLKKKLASFKELTVLDSLNYERAKQKAYNELLARYPEANTPNSADAGMFAVDWDLYAVTIPLLIVAWAEKEPLTAAMVEASTSNEFRACLAEVYRLNPYLDPKAPDPNA